MIYNGTVCSSKHDSSKCLLHNLMIYKIDLIKGLTLSFTLREVPKCVFREVEVFLFGLFVK